MAKRTNNVFVCYLWFRRALSDLTVNKKKNCYACFHVISILSIPLSSTSFFEKVDKNIIYFEINLKINSNSNVANLTSDCKLEGETFCLLNAGAESTG